METETAGAYPTRQEAELVRARLEAAGIPASIHTDDAGGMYPDLSSSGVRVVVRQEDLEAARAILAGSPD